MNQSAAPHIPQTTWINPIGGYGDMLMVSGVLKQVIERDPFRSFNLVRRSMYRTVFQHHPAIQNIGHPQKGDHIIGTDYWRFKLGANENRPYQVLARLFGLPTPAEEILYLPGVTEIDPLLEKAIPWGKNSIVIAPHSDSPRKMMTLGRWRLLVKQLKASGFFVIQIGRLRDEYIENSYSLLGMTSPAQLISIIRRADILITLDNFAMHASHLAGTPAVVLWGPTHSDIYGYPGQRHLRADITCRQIDLCINANAPNIYDTSCPIKENNCMDLIPIEAIYEAVHGMLAQIHL